MAVQLHVYVCVFDSGIGNKDLCNAKLAGLKKYNKKLQLF